jgi:hypothetical protein
MDLTEYEQAKFQLAAILRLATVARREKHPDIQPPFRDLFARPAEDRFNLVMVGRFSRGKTVIRGRLLDAGPSDSALAPA